MGGGFCFHRDVGGCDGWGLNGCVCRCMFSSLLCLRGLVVLFVRGCRTMGACCGLLGRRVVWNGVHLDVVWHPRVIVVRADSGLSEWV